MSFFETFTEKSKEVADKAKDQIDIAKLNSNIAKQEKRINEMYKIMGELYYSTHKDNPGIEYADYFNNIIEAENNIKKYKIEICKVKETAYCGECGYEVTKGTTFCPKCGNKIIIVE